MQITAHHRPKANYGHEGEGVWLYLTSGIVPGEVSAQVNPLDDGSTCVKYSYKYINESYLKKHFVAYGCSRTQTD